MELRNKKTGEKIEGYIRENSDLQVAVFRKVYFGKLDQVSKWYDSLAELNEEWEDYEEPKEFWYISAYGNLCKSDRMDDLHRGAKEIGNYFETEEEAKKAVEKLKAWKRLKKAGFKFKGWKFTPDMKHTKGNFVTIKAEIPYIVESQAHLNLLFGGEE